MSKRFTSSMLAVTLFASAAGAVPPDVPDDAPKILNDPATAMLADARCAEVKTESASEITCFLSFPDSVPNFFYEIDSATNRFTIKLVNTKTGGMVVAGKIDTVNLGPVATLCTREETRNKNEAMKSLTPEWYSVVLVTLSLKPMIRCQEDIVISEIENAITISFPWPDVPKQRKKYYTFVKKERRRGLVISLIGIGAAGLAAGGYYGYRHYYLPDDTPAALEPVMPEHPSEP